jgi:hypothetical protein
MLEAIAETFTFRTIVMDPSLITSNNMIFKEIKVKVVQKKFSRATCRVLSLSLVLPS